MKKRMFIIGFVLAFCCVTEGSGIKELKDRLPEILAKSAAHYKALDAAVTPLMKNADGMMMVPQGYKRDKKMYDMRGIEWWTSGHFPGSLWYLYEATGDEFFKDRATIWTENLKPISRFKGNHDIGFMMYCSFGNARRLLKTGKYDHLLVEAADTLCLRFEPKLGLIRSWGKVDNRKDFLVIPDNMMNLELLEWAAKSKNGEKRFADVARSHADVTMKNHFRADGGTYHVLNYSQKDGRIQEIRRGQGASCFTAWSRGQSWAIYGYTMMYRETGLQEYLDAAENIAGMILKHLPEDGIPYWDFNAPDIPDALRDASAGAIMASAFIELSTLTADKEAAETYLETARKQLLTFSSEEYLARPGENGFFLLKHCVGNIPENSEVDVPLSYADYYFLEALVRYSKLIR